MRDLVEVGEEEQAIEERTSLRPEVIDGSPPTFEVTAELTADRNAGMWKMDWRTALR